MNYLQELMTIREAIQAKGEVGRGDVFDRNAYIPGMCEALASYTVDV